MSNYDTMFELSLFSAYHFYFALLHMYFDNLNIAFSSMAALEHILLYVDWNLV